jgi:hypothetical protein
VVDERPAFYKAFGVLLEGIPRLLEIGVQFNKATYGVRCGEQGFHQSRDGLSFSPTQLREAGNMFVVVPLDET